MTDLDTAAMLATVTQNLRTARERAGISVIEFARRCGWRVPPAWLWLDGECSSMTATQVAVAARVLGVNVADLFRPGAESAR